MPHLSSLEIHMKRLAAAFYRLCIAQIDRDLDRLLKEHVQSANCHDRATIEAKFDALAIRQAVLRNRLDRYRALLS
jgi:hypothetical protein